MTGVYTGASMSLDGYISGPSETGFEHLTDAWGGNHPMGRPVVVVTHNVPDGWPREGSPFMLVTDGSALTRACSTRSKSTSSPWW